LQRFDDAQKAAGQREMLLPISGKLFRKKDVKKEDKPTRAPARSRMAS
jgi:hypothetical protein